MDFSFAFVLMGLTIVGIIAFVAYYVSVVMPKRGTTEWIERAVEKPRFRYVFTLYRMEKRDILPIVIITAVFTFVSFFQLGDTDAPQTFHRFGASNSPLVLELDEQTHVSQIMYYTGLYTGGYRVLYSIDGIEWTEVSSLEEDKTPMEQNHANLFKWRSAQLKETFTAKYIKLDATKLPMELGELAIYDDYGNLVTAHGSDELFDEQELIPERATYMNGMYFDEIYHGRTAYETIRGVYPYETVHPPLGKTIISIGIQMFGMTPFGWRFTGTLFGVAMIAAIYILLKNMFGKTFIASCGTLLLGFEFMRFTQTRIATVDTYAVFFIILSFLFMYRYLTVTGDRPLREGIRQLGFSGLFFGIGVACKWIVIYAGFGLLAMYLLKIITDYRYYYADREDGGYATRVVKTLALTALFFIVIPVIIYVLSYIPFGTAKGMSVRGGMLWDPEYYKMVWKVQVNTFTYHSDLVATHPYSSWWYQWVVDQRPILYYLDYPTTTTRSSFAAFGNPLIWWGGLVAIIIMIIESILHKDTRALVIVIGYFAQLVPWMLVSRIVFAYHYFPSTIFLVLAIAHMFNTMYERGGRTGRKVILAFTSGAGVLFVLFYPVLSGMPVSTNYMKQVIKWLPSWPF